jgi:cytochrome c
MKRLGWKAKGTLRIAKTTAAAAIWRLHLSTADALFGRDLSLRRGQMGHGICGKTGLFLTVAAIALGASSALAAPLHAARNPLLLRVADATAGKAVFASKCAICHTLEKGGPAKFGPNLHAIFGQHAGTVPGFNFSPAMKKSGIVWNAKTLDAYIADPQKAVPGNKMPFPGLPDKSERDNLIAYLAQATR